MLGFVYLHPLSNAAATSERGGGVSAVSLSADALDNTGEFPYAKCFICGEIGHLTRSCPDNPRGLYPRGLPHPLSFVHLD